MMFLVCSTIGGWLSRMCGGGWPASRWSIRWERFIYPIAYTAPFFPSLHISLIAYVAALAGKVTGHGQYLGMGRRVQDSEPDTLDPIVRFFMGVDVPIGQYPSYWRCVAGMAITGVAETLGAGLIYAVIINPLYGILWAISGVFKAVGYMIGDSVVYDLGFKRIDANVYGEFINGARAYGVIAWLLLNGLS